MKRVIAMIMAVAMMLSLVPTGYVQAQEESEFDWSNIAGNEEAALAEAQRLLAAGEATLVTAEDWTTGGDYKDAGGNYVESTRFWTNNGGNITMTAVNEGAAVKITSTAVSSDGGGQANFKLLPDTTEAGDQLFYAFRIKAVSANGSTEEGGVVTTSIRVRPNMDSTGEGQDIKVNGITCTVGEEAKLVCGVGAPSVATPASTVTSGKPFGALIFQNGLYTEEFEISDLCVVNLSKAASSGEEPEPPIVDEEAEQKLADALELVETGYGTLLSDENWTTIGSTKGDITWTTKGGSYTGELNVTEEAVTGQTFTKALHIETTAAAAAINDVQVCFRLDGKADTADGKAPIQTGDEIFYAFRIKGNLADSSKILMRPNPNDFNSDTNVRTALGNPNLTGVDAWTWVTGTGTALKDSGDFGSIVFQLGLDAQEFSIADFTVINKSRGINTETDEDVIPFTYEEIQEKIAAGEATLVSYPNLSDEEAYVVEYKDNITAENFKVGLKNDVANQDFTEALNIKTTATGDNAWSAQVYFNLDQTKPIGVGDVLFFECKVRGISTVTNKEAMFVTANTRIRPDRATSSNFDFTSFINTEDGDAWDTVYGACIAPASSMADGVTDAYGFADGAWVFQLSSAIQELDIAEVKVYNFGKTYTVGQMPVMEKTYFGMEEDAQWRKDALERIEEIRKQDVAITIEDGEGNPIEGAEVKVDMTKHEFGFGTIVNADSYATWDSTTQSKYREAFETVAHNRAGFENALKHYYITNPDRQALVDEWLTYFEEQDMDVRGHVLIYGDDNRLRNVDMSGASTDMEEKALFTSGTEEGNAALKEWTMNHINTYVNKYRGQIYNWDVVNENIPSHLPSADTGNMFWSDRLDGYDTLVEWFEAAHEADPDAKLTYNDYGILASSGTADQYYELCEYLVENDAPITTLGVQGHVGVMSPVTIINTLDRLSELGLEIEITEFTCDEGNEALQAQFTKDFMIAVFSVENVSSITTWGFWEDCIYAPGVEMFDSDFNLRPNGEVWVDMIYNQWWTKENGTTNAEGAYAARGYKGEHTVTVTVGDVEQTFDISLGDEAVTLNLVCADGEITQKVEVPEVDEELEVAKKALADAIAESEELDAEDYTEESWEAYADAIEAAKKLAEDATVEEINAAVAAIEEAKENLEEVQEIPEPIVNPFGDVEEDDWYAPYVMFAYKYNLMGGKGEMPDGSLKFDPGNTITRAEFVTMLYSKENKPAVEYVDTFTDVADDKWYTDAILWAAEKEIVGGKKADYFDVNGKITRQEIALILYKYALYKEYDVSEATDTDLSGFADAANVSNWATTGMKWAVQYNIIGGKTVNGETTLSPGGNAIRAEAATMMKAFMGAYEGITE